MFEAESKGLKLLNEGVSNIAPEVIALEENEDEMILILSFIESGSPHKDFWRDFARKLATLHSKTNDLFGLDHPNYIGSLPQSNQQHDRWTTFFILERIEPQLKRAVDGGNLSREIPRQFSRLFLKLEEIFPDERSSLLHGDLWSGNYMVDHKGMVCLVDPAVYFGFREMDLAMMKLFGGFDASVFSHYHEFFPLEKGFEQRMDICNLYPLLVHVNLFGAHYAHQVEGLMKRF